MIRLCSELDKKAILSVINDAAIAYKGFIPPECFQEPYMSIKELMDEINDGVQFWCYEEQGTLQGVMGIQDRGEVVLFRHAYVRTNKRRTGIGTQLLRTLESLTDKPVMIGTWQRATWAISFYEKNGYRVLSREETDFVLRKYWNLPELQIITSVALVDTKRPAPRFLQRVHGIPNIG